MLETHFNCIIFFQISALPHPSQHSSDRFDMYCRHCHEDRFEFIEQFQKGICSAFISGPTWTVRGCSYSSVCHKGTVWFNVFRNFIFFYTSFFVYIKSMQHHCCLEAFRLKHLQLSQRWRWAVSFAVSRMGTDQRDGRWRASEWRKLV